MKRAVVGGQESPESVRLHQALTDLAKLLVWSRGGEKPKTQLIFELTDIGFTPTRIAELIGWKPKDVTSALSKRRKRAAGTRRQEE